MELSVCIITKNEADKLEKNLRALSPYPWEVVVVDTGSQDNSREIAKAHGASLYEFPWVNDFAAAKNFAVSKARNDFVLVLDTDEYLEKLDYPRLVRQIEQNPGSVGRILLRDMLNMDGTEKEIHKHINRIFNREKFCYQGRIHEQIIRKDAEPESEERWKYETYYTELSVIHDGYSGTKEERGRKAERNIRLLVEEQAAKPDDPYLQYQLGKSYYMAGQYKEAAEWFDKALYYDLDPKLEYVIDTVETYGYALLELGEAGKALMLEGVYEEFGNSADFQFLMGLIYMNNEMFDRAVEEFKKAAGQKSARMVGVNSYLAWYNAGVIRECLGDLKTAKQYYVNCGNYEKAKERLKAIK